MSKICTFNHISLYRAMFKYHILLGVIFSPVQGSYYTILLQIILNNRKFEQKLFLQSYIIYIIKFNDDTRALQEDLLKYVRAT